MWLNALKDQGVDVRLADAADTLTLRHRDAVASWRIRRFRRTPRPSEIESVDPEQVLWLPRLTTSLRDRLVELRASWVTDTGDIHVQAPWGLVTTDVHSPSDSSGSQETGVARRSRGVLNALQVLLEDPTPTTQHQIASSTGVSQPRVSQILKELGQDGLTERLAGGWQVSEPERAFAAWLSGAAPPAVLTTHWYSLASSHQQLAEVWDQAQAEGAEVRLCGDWAADLLAPWRHPGLIVIHADRTLDLEGRSFVPASADTGTLALQVGPVRGDWRPAPDVVAVMTSESVTWPVAPITEIVREIVSADGPDADQATDQLTSAWLRARAAVVAGQDR